jgi:cell shape-determining protein MreC
MDPQWRALWQDYCAQKERIADLEAEVEELAAELAEERTLTQNLQAEIEQLRGARAPAIEVIEAINRLKAENRALRLRLDASLEPPGVIE